MKYDKEKLEQHTKQLIEMFWYVNSDIVWEGQEMQENHFDKLPKAEQIALIVSNEGNLFKVGNRDVDFLRYKPYLFPMSSMTDDQKKDLQSLMVQDSYGILYHTIESYDYLNENHFDFRGLIERGFAIDCTNLNIY